LSGEEDALGEKSGVEVRVHGGEVDCNNLAFYEERMHHTLTCALTRTCVNK